MRHSGSSRFLRQIEAEATITSLRAVNRLSLLAAFVFLSPTVFLDSIGDTYDPWIRASHLILSAAGFALFWVTRRGSRFSIEFQTRLIPLYLLGVNLSQVLIMQRLQEPLDVTPGILTVVVMALIDIPLHWFVASVVLQGGSVLLLASAAGWTDPWVSAVLISMAVIAVFFAVFLNRRVHKSRMQSLRARQLASEEALREEIEERSRLQEREIANEKLQSLGRLAGGVAHDLNNLLVPIVGNVDLLLDGDPTSDQRDQLLSVMDAAERATLLTRQLTAYAGKGGVADQVFDLGKEISETHGLVLRTVPTPLAISWSPPAEPVWITGDRAQVQQALLNLLLNAAEAVEDVHEPGVNISLERDVTAPGDTERHYARVVVRDRGRGIPNEDIGRIFDPFFTTKGSGRGLGLSAAIGAAHRQGGHLVARNPPDGGAEFALYLRLADGPPPSEERTPRISEVAGRVLVVDDEAPVRDVAEQTLQRAGFDVVTSSTGSDALSLAASTPLDVVVMDLRMPGLDGRTAINRLRELRPELPILICTGYGAEAAGWSEALERISVLAKPYRGEELVASVRRLAKVARN